MDKKALLNTMDETVSALHLRLFGERPGLSTFLFHSIFKNRQEISRHHVLPQEHMTVDAFRRFLDYFLSHNYQFVTPDAVRSGLPDPKARYGLITFDDGYFNNTLIAPVLAEYKVPAVFFISTAYITEGKKFWSDVIYYERKKQHLSDETILKEIISLKSLKIAQVEDYLTKKFGVASMKPLGDIDSPMTPGELQAFARQPFVHLGNHTHQHEILTNLTEEEIDREFRISQQLMHEMAGVTPWFVSYPNGSFSDRVSTMAMQHDLTMGITTIQQKNRLPLQSDKHGQVLLHRFNPVAKNDIVNCSKFRSSFQLKTHLKKWLQ